MGMGGSNATDGNGHAVRETCGGGGGGGGGGQKGKGSGGGSSSSGGERGGGKGLSFGSKGRSVALRRGRSRGLPVTGGVSGGEVESGANGDGSAKRSGLRRREEGGGSGGNGGRHAATMMVEDGPLLAAGGNWGGRGGGGLSVETRRGKALREGGGGVAPTSNVHVEAVSRVAQLSLHSSGRTSNGASATTARREAHR